MTYYTETIRAFRHIVGIWTLNRSLFGEEMDKVNFTLVFIRITSSDSRIEYVIPNLGLQRKHCEP